MYFHTLTFSICPAYQTNGSRNKQTCNKGKDDDEDVDEVECWGC